MDVTRQPDESSHGDFTRRAFLASAAAGAAVGAVGCATTGSTLLTAPGERLIRQAGPAANYTPHIKAAFVRRKGEYGMRWPGAVYDGERARKDYTCQLDEAAKTLNIDLDMRPEPIHSLAEGEEWVASAEGANADGLILIVLDRQEHAWPTAAKAVESALPAVIFSPVGTSFTTNTAPLANKTGAIIYSTDDFSQAIFGMKMLKAHAKLRETRFIILKGTERKDSEVLHLGTKLRYVPAQDFLECYRQTLDSDEIHAIAQQYMKQAGRIAGPSEQDVVNGVKSYVVARTILEREEGDAISMDCLGALGKSEVSLPCIAWSRMLDQGIPAACEADIRACLTHALVQYLFDRPGFQQDPVADTAKGCLIGAHCTCPTRLRGFNQPPEPYYLTHHHGNRDAVPRPMWREGESATVTEVFPSNKADTPPQLLISAGHVVENIAVPPAGGCVVSVSLKLDGVSEVLTYPGFHQIFLYGDYRRELANYAQLFGMQELVV